jgi:gluconolactonase
MTFRLRQRPSLPHLSLLLGSLGLGAAVLGTPACGTTPPVMGSGGAGSGGAPTGGGGTSSGGQGAGGTGSGGAPLGTGGGSGGSGTGGSGTGGSGTGGNGSGGDGSGGAPAAVFTCPSGSDAMSPTLSGTPMPLPGTFPQVPGGGTTSNAIIEGPVWIAGTLYISQMRDYGPHNPSQILTHDGVDYTPWMPDSLTNGLALRADGMILAASHGVGGLVEIDPAAVTPSGTTVIAEYMGSRLNSPNDLVIRSDGNVYFTDPDYQCDSPCDDQPDNRVYRYPAGGGDLEAIATDHDDPNGITLSLDETLLYVAGSGGIDVYTLDGSGAVTAGPDTFGDAGISGVDGLAIDCAGNVYLAVGGDVTVLDSDGAPVGTITVPNSTTNVAFGGASGTVLYITTMSSAGVYSLDVGIPGSPY